MSFTVPHKPCARCELNVATEGWSMGGPDFEIEFWCELCVTMEELRILREETHIIEFERAVDEALLNVKEYTP